MSKAPNPKFFMLLTCAAVIVGGGLSFFEYSGLQATQGRVSKLEKDSLNQNDLENRLLSSQAKLQECSASLNHLENGVPELDYVPTMLKELENVGIQHGLIVLGVRPVPKSESSSSKEKKSSKKQYQELDIEVSCRGNYRSVDSFVAALQSFPKIVAARTVSLTPKTDSKNQNAPPMLDATISLRSYLFPPDKSEMKKAMPSPANPTQEPIKNAS